MIQKNELKINNIVIIDNEKHRPTDSGKEAKIISIQEDAAGLQLLEDNYGVNTFGQFYKYLKPIPLTEEFLLKFGFIYRGIYYHFPYNDIFKLEQHKLNNAYWLRHSSESLDCVRINYVHQLQNLYFALTGQELNLA